MRDILAKKLNDVLDIYEQFKNKYVRKSDYEMLEDFEDLLLNAVYNGNTLDDNDLMTYPAYIFINKNLINSLILNISDSRERNMIYDMLMGKFDED